MAAHGFQTYLDDKTDLKPSDDPVEDLRASWGLHVGFGLAHPAICSLMYGDPRPGAPGPVSAAVALRAVLPQSSALTSHERALLQEWLDRIASD